MHSPTETFFVVVELFGVLFYEAISTLNWRDESQDKKIESWLSLENIRKTSANINTALLNKFESHSFVCVSQGLIKLF